MVRLEGTIKRFIGLSTDFKPESTPDDPLPPGSSFLETDTGKIARYGTNGWEKATEADDVRDLLAALLDEVRRLTLMVGLATGVETQTPSEGRLP